MAKLSIRDLTTDKTLDANAMTDVLGGWSYRKNTSLLHPWELDIKSIDRGYAGVQAKPDKGILFVGGGAPVWSPTGTPR